MDHNIHMKKKQKQQEVELYMPQYYAASINHDDTGYWFVCVCKLSSARDKRMNVIIKQALKHLRICKKPVDFWSPVRKHPHETYIVCCR